MFHKALLLTATAATLALTSPTFAEDASATIDAKAPVLTMINVLTPVDGNQDALVAQLERALSSTLVNQPGFLSGNVHRSLDSNHVVNYAQWSDQASLEAFVAKLQAGNAPEMAQVFAMGTPDFHPYAVVSTHRPAE